MHAGNGGTQERRARGFSHDNWRLNAKKTDGARERSPSWRGGEGREDDHDPPEMTAVAVRENSDEIRRRSSSVKAAKVDISRAVAILTKNDS